MPLLKITSTRPALHTPFLKPRYSQNSFKTNSQKSIQTRQLSQNIQHIIATTALLESRAALYGDYLLATFAKKDARWLDGVRQWTNEETSHGKMLSHIAMQLGMHSPPEALLARYLADVPYHDNNGVSVRGSVGKELVARCVVEALASTYYRALADSVCEPTTHGTLTFLAQDEARHFGMFRRMLIEERNTDRQLTNFAIITAALKRMMALGDEQISYASWLVGQARDEKISDSTSRSTYFSKRFEANVYAAKLYPLYRYKHLHYAAGMLLQIGNLRSVKIQPCLAISLWCGVRLRAFAANVALWFS
jgi:Mn-containing catalase